MGRRAVILAALVAAGVGVWMAVVNGNAIECESVEMRCTEADSKGKYDDVVMTALNCPKIGLVFPDGGLAEEPYLGCKVVKKCSGSECPVKKSAPYECARRPKGAPKNSCLRKRPATGLGSGDGGYDFGDENVMQPGDWIGAGCEPCPCTQVAGIPWKK